MANLSLCEISQSQLSDTPVIPGQLVCCLDTGNFYRDTDSGRLSLSSDLIVTASLPLAPLTNKLYLLKPDQLYIYDGQWYQLNDQPDNIDLLRKIEAAFTNTLKNNYDAAYTHSTQAHAPSDAERNVIVGIQKNGADIPADSSTRKVNITVPTKLSQLTNDAGYKTTDSNTTYDLGASASAANGNVTISLTGSDATADSVSVKGAGSVSVTSDAEGIITISAVNTTYSAATASAAGLMSAADKSKLDGIAAGANNYVHPAASGNKHIPAGGSSGQILRWSADGTAAWGADSNTTYSAGSGLSLSGTTINHSNSVTAGTAQGDASKTLAFGGTFTIPTVTYDAQGHITAKGTTTMTMPVTPTTITGNAGSATKLAAARTIALSGAAAGTATSFNGTANITIPVTSLNAVNLTLASEDTLILNGGGAG